MAVPMKPTMPRKPRKPIRITAAVHDNALRRPLKPRVVWDSDISGFALHTTSKRGFWAIHYSPHGLNPRTGKRWGSTRHELGDAKTVAATDARSAALTALGLIKGGGDPHRERLAARASMTAARGVLPTTVGDTLDAYERALMVRSAPSLRTRKQSVRYARRAVMLLKASALSLAAIDVRMVRMLVETAPGSDAQRRHIYGGLNRFLKWCRKQGLIEINPCDALDRHDRPKPGRARDHVPSLKTLRAIWRAAEGEAARDLLRFLLLLPLRRDEASGLRWSEVLFDQGRIRLDPARTKKSAAHELPLSPPARAILEGRKITATNDLVFSTAAGAQFTNWDRLLTRIRKAIDKDKRDRFWIHDFRRAFVSHLAGEFDVDLLDQCLGHTRRGVLGVYQRSARWPERVDALELWSKYILGKAEPDSMIVPFVRRANVS
jgi:integrase